MKINRRFLALGLVAVSLLLSGCGTTLYELTADEESLIIKYAAHYIAKHNVYQKDGLSIEVAEDEIENVEPENPDNPEDPSNPSGGQEDKRPTVGQAMNLPKGITLTYDGSYVADHVKENAAYSEEAGVGFEFYVLKFKMENTTKEDITIDNFSKDIVFKLTSGSVVIKSKAYPILSNELSSYVGTVKAGETVDVILMFKVKTEDAGKISDVVLEIYEGKTTIAVKL